MKTISAIVLTNNSDDLIDDCLRSLSFVDEVIVVDDHSSDKTLKKVKKYKNTKVIEGQGDFARKRNMGAKTAKGDWLLYVDDDERVTPQLRAEISRAKSGLIGNFQAYAIPRRNVFLGRPMKFGGWWPDYVLRLMQKESLKRWKGKLHEQPEIKGKVGKLKNSLLHISHRSLSEMVEKTNEWSEIEAKLLYKSGHPPVTWWRFISIAFREFWYRGIRKLGFLDGVVGVIEIIYQMFSRMITYAKLWELQLENKK